MTPAAAPDAVDIDGVTEAWLSSALGRPVRSVRSERIGTGQTGAAYRLSLVGDDVPATLVAKVAAGDEAARQRVAPGYRNEVGFYADVAHTVSVRTPRCWAAAISDDAVRFTLLLEDLHPRRPGVQADGCPVERAAGALANLVGLHAPRWDDASLLDLPFVGATTVDDAAFVGEITVSAVEVFVERYAGELDPGDVTTLRESAAAVADWLVARPSPAALIHGDYRLDNLMLGPEPADVVAVDWQTLALGPPLRDVGYFLGTCLEPGDRRTAEHELVAGYHAGLVAHGVAGYDADRCFEDYRLGLLQAPMITCLGAAYATAERSDRADAMFLAMARRSCTAIRDLRPLDLL